MSSIRCKKCGAVDEVVQVDRLIAHVDIADWYLDDGLPAVKDFGGGSEVFWDTSEVDDKHKPFRCTACDASLTRSDLEIVPDGWSDEDE